MTDLHELPEWQAWELYKSRRRENGLRTGKAAKRAEALIAKLAELVEEAEAKQHDVYYDLWLVENEALRKAEAINDQWEVKAADLMRERNEAGAEGGIMTWLTRQLREIWEMDDAFEFVVVILVAVCIIAVYAAYELAS